MSTRAGSGHERVVSQSDRARFASPIVRPCGSGLTLADGARVARDLDPTAPEALLHALTAVPRRPQKRRRPRATRLLLPLAAAAAVTGAAVLEPGGSTDLAAKAYAQTAPPPAQILYVRTTMRETIDTPAHHDVNTSTTEVWERGGVSHSILRYGPGLRHRTDEWLAADGTLRLRSDVSGEETTRRQDGQEQREYIDRKAPGFVATFRRDYERGRLDARGDARFAGRPARRYVVTTEGDRQESYLDAESGAPLGSKHTVTLSEVRIGPDRKPLPEPGKRSGTASYVTTVEALDHLPPTPANLAKLGGCRRSATVPGARCTWNSSSSDCSSSSPAWPP